MTTTSTTTPHRRRRLLLGGTLVAALGLAPATAATAADPPSNDRFADATIVTLDYSDTIDTTMATTGEAEDLAAKDACGSPPFDSSEPPDATVWFSLTIPGDEPERILVSAAPPRFVTPGFNVVVDTPEGFECVAGGPVEVVFLAEPGVTYYIQSIDDQIPDGFPDEPLDEVNGGQLTISIISLGTPLPDICPGIALDEPLLPPGLNLIMGTDGDDDLVGTDGDDLIFGLEGNDSINGRGGNDVIFGCDGDDTINGGDGDDVIFGDDPGSIGDPESTAGGDDGINGGKGNDEIRGGPGDDNLQGGDGDDALFGMQGDDAIQAGKGADFAVGGFGEDNVHGGQGDDEVFGGFDSDNVHGGPGDDFVNGDVPAPFPDESPHTDRCNGGPGENELVGCEQTSGRRNK